MVPAMDCLTAAVSLSATLCKLSVALVMRSISMSVRLCTTTTEWLAMLVVTQLYNSIPAGFACACKRRMALIKVYWLLNIVC